MAGAACNAGSSRFQAAFRSVPLVVKHFAIQRECQMMYGTMIDVIMIAAEEMLACDRMCLQGSGLEGFTHCFCNSSSLHNLHNLSAFVFHFGQAGFRGGICRAGSLLCFLALGGAGAGTFFRSNK